MLQVTKNPAEEPRPFVVLNQLRTFQKLPATEQAPEIEVVSVGFAPIKLTNNFLWAIFPEDALKQAQEIFPNFKLLAVEPAYEYARKRGIYDDPRRIFDRVQRPNETQGARNQGPDSKRGNRPPR